MWFRIFRYTITIAIVIAAFAVYFYFENHPRTHDAFVRAAIRPISSPLSGRVLQVFVNDHEHVKPEQPLFQIDPRPYQLASKKAEIELQIAQAHIQELKTTLLQQQNQIKIADQQLIEAQNNYARAYKLHQQNAISTQSFQNQERTFLIARDRLKQAQEQVNITKDQLSETGTATLTLKKVKNDYEVAEYQLSLTTIISHHHGIVANLYLVPGTQVRANQTLFALVELNSYWIQANVKENEMGKIKKGQIVSVYLRMYPGKTFKGKIIGISPGIARGTTNPDSGLIQTKPENDWVNLPQRIPVMVKLVDFPVDLHLTVGSSASVYFKK